MNAHVNEFPKNKFISHILNVEALEIYKSFSQPSNTNDDFFCKNKQSLCMEKTNIHSLR